MATKQVEIPEVGSITIYKRRGARSIRLSIRDDKVRVTIPYWLPYQSGIEFVRTKTEWIAKNRISVGLLENGMSVGKQHRLQFEYRFSASRVASKVKEGVITVTLPKGVSEDDSKAQAAALRASIRALKLEAEELLPGRLRRLASEHGFDFKSVEVKQMKSRWGSCNHRKEIVLNCYLMQLPWHLIDYVLLHELTHTRIMAHGPKFWKELGRYVANLPQVRKDMKVHRPMLNAPLNTSGMQ